MSDDATSRALFRTAGVRRGVLSKLALPAVGADLLAAALAAPRCNRLRG